MTIIQEKLEKMIQESKDEVSILFTKINGNTIYKHQSELQVVSASTIKTAILLAVLNEVKNDKISLEDEIFVSEKILLEDSEVFESGACFCTLMELLMWMMISSDNTATNCLIQTVGMETINQYICDELKCKDTSLQRLMLDFDAIEKGYNNYTSMEDMLLLFTKLWNTEILNEHLCQVAKEVLYNQRCQNQIMRYIYKPTLFAHKTGELDYRTLDVGVMKMNDEYYFIGISIKSENIKGNPVLMGKLGRTIYEYLESGAEGNGKCDCSNNK